MAVLERDTAGADAGSAWAALHRMFDELAEAHGSRHPETLVAQMHLGIALVKCGESEKARGEAVLESACTGCMEQLGAQHRYTVAAREALDSVRD